MERVPVVGGSHAADGKVLHDAELAFSVLGGRGRALGGVGGGGADVVGAGVGVHVLQVFGERLVVEGHVGEGRALGDVVGVAGGVDDGVRVFVAEIAPFACIPGVVARGGVGIAPCLFAAADELGGGVEQCDLRWRRQVVVGVSSGLGRVSSAVGASGRLVIVGYARAS